MDKMALAITAVCRNGGFSAFLETFVLVESSGIFSNFGAESPPLLQAAKRYGGEHSHQLFPIFLTYILLRRVEVSLLN